MPDADPDALYAALADLALVAREVCDDADDWHSEQITQPLRTALVRLNALVPLVPPLPERYDWTMTDWERERMREASRG